MKFLITHINILIYYINKEASRKNVTEVNKKAFEEMLELMDQVKKICEENIK